MTTTRSSVTTQLRPQSALTVAASLACGALVLVTLAPAADAQPVSDSSTSSSSTTGPDSEGQLRSILAAQMAQGPATSGAYVVNLDDGHVVFDDRGDTKRLSASVTKLYTTSTALIRLGQGTRLSTGVLGTGRRVGTTWTGDLYLRGAGDFTFGTVAFARKAYGSRASVERLATQLRQSGIRHIRGRVLADASLFGDNGGSEFGLVLCRNPLFGPRCPYGPAGRFERPIPNGPRTPIGFNRGLRSDTSAVPQKRPVRFAARGLTRALRQAGIRVDGSPGAAVTPPRARLLATAASPRVARLIKLINRPSDNYGADAMLRLLGARVTDRGTRAGGASVIRNTMRKAFGLTPSIRTGSGETLQDRTSPAQIVALLKDMASRPAGPAFTGSLSVAGRNGTLRRLAGTAAAGRCQLKDGTRVDPVLANTTLNLVGYCTSVGGTRFAFAVMMNGMPMEFVPPDKIVSPAYALQDVMVEALAGYQQ